MLRVVELSAGGQPGPRPSSFDMSTSVQGRHMGVAHWRHLCARFDRSPPTAGVGASPFGGTRRPHEHAGVPVRNRVKPGADAETACIQHVQLSLCAAIAGRPAGQDSNGRPDGVCAHTG